jgi:hypothetical protein
MTKQSDYSFGTQLGKRDLEALFHLILEIVLLRL